MQPSATLRRVSTCLLAIGLVACGEAEPAQPPPSPAAAGAAAASEPAGAGAVPAGALQLRTDAGEVVGRLVAGDVRAFLGIPYAQPPVGALRWKPPEPPVPWSGARDAGQLSLPCPQAAWAGALDAAESEDCLYLNVWTPRAAASAPRAVMVWIHGGGNTNGSASEPGYDGRRFAERHGVVLVSLNYRLGVLGFFSHDELLAEGTRSGNQGLWDQQLALRWVRDNVAAFGGDPGNVTIFGESAGSLDVCMHVAAASSRGLFQRAVSQSGGCTTLRPTHESAAARAPDYAQLLGCSPEAGLACLRAKSDRELLQAVDEAAQRGIAFAPVVDGDFVAEQPRVLFDRGEIAKVPYLLGSTHDEGTFLVGGEARLMSDEAYLAALAERFGAEAAPSIAAQYPSSAFADAPNRYYAAIARAVGDARLVCSTSDVAARALANGVPVFLYNFQIPVDGPNGPLGAAHAAELGYVFGTVPAPTPEQQAASDLMQAYWASFAKRGDPNDASLPTWPAFGAQANVRLNFAALPSVVHDFRAEECAFWRARYDQAFATTP